jgi:cob(I)alamin adenosyltransferase
LATREEEWTVGELARAAGVTVRALHHYDRIGLLVPSSRSGGGHRRYSSQDVERLYRIVALRDLGFGLEDIGAVLDSGSAAVLETARRHLRQAEIELERRRQLRERLHQLVESLERSEEPSPNQLLQTMEAISMTIRLDKISTGIGDRGVTALGDGTTVSKTDPVLDSADLEELAAHIGVALASGSLPDQHREWLERVQNDLFDLGAGPAEAAATDESYSNWLESACEQANRDLPPLDSFVLPGGSAPAAQLHVCRTTCRRLERWAWGADGVHPELGRYLNRLSDFLFILSRNAAPGAERLWEPRGAS